MKKIPGKEIIFDWKKISYFPLLQKICSVYFFKITVHFPFLKTNGKICEKIRVA